MLKNLPFEHGCRLRTVLPRLVISAAMLLVLAVTASAYTLVLRSGQRLDIPDEFILTRTTLTYEISPGFNKTLLLTVIDVPATERANREAPGSFYRHRQETQAVAEPAGGRAVKTLTNIDLDAVRQRRVESEQAYEARRKQLGLPTVADTRRRQEAEDAELRAQLREDSFNKRQEESYWRGRARALRTEIAALDTQINYLRGRITEMNESSLNNQSIITGIYPIWPNNQPWLGNGQWGTYPNYPNYPNYPAYPGNPNWRVPGYPGYRPARPPYGLGYPYGYGYPNGDNSANANQRSDLTYRLDDLLVRRAGLISQWRTLEDDARDARIPQVWLEP